MQQWSDVFSKDDADAIHAYLIKQSQDAYLAQQAQTAACSRGIAGALKHLPLSA